MITLIARFRLWQMEANQTTKKKGKTMNPLTHFKRIRILPLLLAAGARRARQHQAVARAERRDRLGT